MCGYFANLRESQSVMKLLDELGVSLPYPVGQYYQRQIVDSLVTRNNDEYSLSNALWWYQLKTEQDKLVPNGDLTTFNARNLDGRMYSKAIKQRRGIVFASEIGESIGVGKNKKSYLMRSDKGIALGAIYKDWNAPDGSTMRSMAIITRPAHPRFAQYHDKSTPLFIPLDDVVIKEWLDPNVESSLIISELLDYPKIFSDLEVTQVKTFKKAEALAETELLEKDEL